MGVQVRFLRSHPPDRDRGHGTDAEKERKRVARGLSAVTVATVVASVERWRAHRTTACGRQHLMGMHEGRCEQHGRQNSWRRCWHRETCHVSLDMLAVSFRYSFTKS